jgi:hypothetical protein
MTAFKQYVWKCPHEGCTTTKGPYYMRALLREAAAEHRRTQHANELPPMEPTHRADARHRHATKPHPGYGL